MSVLVYSDHIENPVLEALGRFAAAIPGSCRAVLFDPASDLMRAAGPSFSSAGVQARFERSSARRQSRAPQLCQRQRTGDARIAAARRH